MIKLIVCSDSHGAKSKIEKIFNDYTFDYLIYLGDGLQDIGAYENLENVIAVRGNCDFFSTYPAERVIEIAGKRFLITHGNTYGVKYGLGSFVKYAKSLGVDVALFGHTHSYVCETIDNITFANPGSLKNGTAMQIDVDDRGISFQQLHI